MPLFGRREENITLKLAETRKNLMNLESEFTAQIRLARNAVMSAKGKSARVSAEDRLRNAYVSLRMVHIAQERLYDVSTTLQLTGAMQDLRKSVAVLNSIDKKSDKSVLLLNRHMKKILERKAASEGGNKQYYDESIEDLLIGENTMTGLLNPEIPLKAVLQQDEETLENVDNFMEFATDEKNGYKGPVTTNMKSSDISDLLDAWSCNRG